MRIPYFMFRWHSWPQKVHWQAELAARRCRRACSWATIRTEQVRLRLSTFEIYSHPVYHRMTLGALIVIDVHARDSIQKMIEQVALLSLDKILDIDEFTGM